MKAILVNVFGGIVNCATIAKGIVNACRHMKLNIPLVVRLEGMLLVHASCQIFTLWYFQALTSPRLRKFLPIPVCPSDLLPTWKMPHKKPSAAFLPEVVVNPELPSLAILE